MEPTRPTQKDIAKIIGVHRATVSLAFKNHPSIPQVTKDKILACAKKLGYAPDPMLSSLAVYRSRNRPKAFHGTLAWITYEVPGQGTPWRQVAIFLDYFKGAAQRAEAHGFRVECFDLHESKLSWKRMASILLARNIQGILLPPHTQPNFTISDFPWERFSAVTFGYSLVKPQLHLVSSTQFRAMVQTMRQVKALGYKRIGFFFFSSHDEKTDHNYLAGYCVETFETANPIPPLFNPESFKPWFDKYRPEVIVTGNSNLVAFLQPLGIKVPADVGVACPVVPERNGTLTGIFEDSFHIGEVAMDFLVAMIHRGERGIPAQPQRLLLEGIWNPGKTVRPK